MGQFNLPYSYYEHILPIDNVAGTFQDEDGYLWIMLSRKGLLRFDGINTQLYAPTETNPKHKLPWDDLSSEAIYPYKNELWITLNNGNAAIIKKGEVICSVNDRRINIHQFIKRSEPLAYIQLDKDRNEAVAICQRTTQIDNEDSNILKWNDSIYFKKIYIPEKRPNQKTSILSYSSTQAILYYEDKNTRIFKGAYYLNLNTGLLEEIKTFNRFISKDTLHFMDAAENNAVYVYHSSVYPKIYLFRGDSLILIPNNFKEEYTKTPYAIVNRNSTTSSTFFSYYNKLYPAFSNILVCDSTSTKSLSIFTTTKNFSINKSTFIPNSYWLSEEIGLNRVDTWVKGFPSNLYTNMPFNVWDIIEDKFGKIWFAAYNKDNNLSFWEPNSYEIVPLKSKYEYFYHGAIMGPDDKMLIPLNDGILQFDGRLSSRSILQKEEGSYKTNITFLLYKSPYDGRIAFCSLEKGLFLYKDGDIANLDDWKNIPENKLGTTNILTVIHDKYGRWWGGRSRSGVFCYEENVNNPKNDKSHRFIIENEAAGIGMMSSAQDSFHNLWFGTNRGLYFYDIYKKGRRTPDTADFEPILPLYFRNTTINTLINYKDSLLFIGDDRGGLGIIDLVSYYANPKNFKFYFYDLRKRYGIKEVFQNCFFIDSKAALWLSSSELVLRLAVPEIPLIKDSIRLEWDHILINSNGIILSRSIEGDHRIVMKASERDLHFYASYLSFSLESYDGFHFVLTNEAGELIAEYTDQKPNFHHIFQKPGNYKLTLRLMERDHVLKELVLALKIGPELTEMPLFWGGIVGLFVIVIIAFFVSWIRTIRQRKKVTEAKLAVEQYKTESANFFVKALINSTHSHFINNMLHHAQALIYDKPILKMIKKLSNIIGTFFKLSREKTLAHSLQAEIDLVENLVYIQKMRFSNRFKEFLIPSSELLDQYGTMTVPVGSIYTHIENAITHGLERKEGGYNGFIKIELLVDSPDTNYISIVVEDNGAGRTFDKAIETTGQGIKNLEEIYAKCNQFNKHELSLYFEDLIDSETKKPLGTKVFTQIPKTYDYDISKH